MRKINLSLVFVLFVTAAYLLATKYAPTILAYSPFAVSQEEVCTSFCQITGSIEGDYWYKDPFPGSQFADPGPPRFLKDENAIEITGSGFHSVRWNGQGTQSPWRRFLSAKQNYNWHQYRLFYPGGQIEYQALIGGEFSNVPWDITIEKWPQWGNQEVLYAGVMTPQPGEEHAYFSRDNRSRRVFAFKKAIRWYLGST